MACIVFDFEKYRIEKTLEEYGFSMKKDDDKNIKMLIKINNSDK